jgi:hypothetical protein
MKEWFSKYIPYIVLTIMIGLLAGLMYSLGVIGFLFFLLGILFIISRDYKTTKSPFDKKKQEFSFYDDWWMWRYDDCMFWTIGGALGAGLSSELAIPIILKYLDWPELIEASIDNTAIVVFTVLGAKILNGLVNGSTPMK